MDMSVRKSLPSVWTHLILSEKIQLGCAAVRLHSLLAILKIKICGEKKQ